MLFNVAIFNDFYNHESEIKIFYEISTGYEISEYYKDEITNEINTDKSN